MTPLRKLAELCLILTTVHFSLGQYKPFDCRRPGIICQSGQGQKGACQNDGTCSCPNSAYEGYDCGLRTDTLKTSGCSVNCGSNGQCYNDGTADRCRCRAGYYGSNCERKRVSVADCTSNSMRVNINPLGKFKGKIYVSMLSLTSACVFTTIPAGGDEAGYQLTLSLSDKPADNPCASQLKKSGNASTYDVIVQYSSAYLAHTDEKHTVTCSDGGNVGLVGTVINSGGLEGIDLGGLSGQSVSQTSLNVPITMQVINEDTGNPVSSVIRVGERLTLQVSMDTTKPNDYVDFFVESCSSFNRDYRSNSATTSGQLLEKVLVLDRCPSPDAMDVLSGDLQKSANTVSIGFRGFKFEGQDSLYMSCSVKLCRAADRASCEPKTCDGSSTRKGYGRKRRQVDEDNKVNVTRKVFVVTFGDNTVMEPVDTSPVVEKERCMENTAFVAIVAVFGIVLTAAVVAAILLCLRTYHLQKKKVGGKA
ncbi:uncharacterized protein LOC135463026 [Liolophura sinensis]|uniref:uncharacterized protein LOC135463026 n=1 Tax=Liolophura sinensis TaxID=3198878 RepID=UPI0031590E90